MPLKQQDKFELDLLLLGLSIESQKEISCKIYDISGQDIAISDQRTDMVDDLLFHEYATGVTCLKRFASQLIISIKFLEDKDKFKQFNLSYYLRIVKQMPNGYDYIDRKGFGQVEARAFKLHLKDIINLTDQIVFYEFPQSEYETRKDQKEIKNF